LKSIIVTKFDYSTARIILWPEWAVYFTSFQFLFRFSLSSFLAENLLHFHSFWITILSSKLYVFHLNWSKLLWLATWCIHDETNWLRMLSNELQRIRPVSIITRSVEIRHQQVIVQNKVACFYGSQCRTAGWWSRHRYMYSRWEASVGKTLSQSINQSIKMLCVCRHELLSNQRHTNDKHKWRAGFRFKGCIQDTRLSYSFICNT